MAKAIATWKATAGIGGTNLLRFTYAVDFFGDDVSNEIATQTQPQINVDMSNAYAIADLNDALIAAVIARATALGLSMDADGVQTFQLRRITLSTPGFISTDYSFPALNVNPNWLLDQINEGALYTIAGGTSVQGPDGVSGESSGTGTFKIRRVVDPDYASQNALEITCTGADTAIAAGDHFDLYTAIEGYDVASLRPGLASASKITIMFDMKFSVAGTYGVSVRNFATSRSYIGEATQNVANAREMKVVSLTLDTTGTWLYTNGVGLYVSFCLAAGATFQTPAGVWTAGNFLTTSAQANFMSSTSNIGYLGRFHVIPGGVALAYFAQDIEREFSKGQRYYEKSYDQGVAVGAVSHNGRAAAGSSGVRGAGINTYQIGWSVTKRAVGTFTIYNPLTGAPGQYMQDDNSVGPSLSVFGHGTHGLEIDYQNDVGRYCAFFQYTENPRLS